MEKFVCKIPKEGRTEHFYILLTEWHTENLSLTIIDNDKAWSSTIDSAKITEFSKTVHKTKEEFEVELKNALTESKKEFTFIIEEENFIVKKIDVKSNIKVKFCNILLKKIPSTPTYLTVVSGLLDQEKANRSNITKLTQEVQDLKAERNDFKTRLQQFANEKASLENILYSKFCEILNAKKEKIAYLESQIGEKGSDQSAESFQMNKNDHTLPEKRTRENYPVAKRKCMTEISSEEPLKFELGEPSSSAIVHNIMAPECDNQNFNHYDSDTDIDTDDESISNLTVTTNVRTVPSPETVQRSSERILPKRASSNILPKRIHNATANKNHKNKEKSVVEPLQCNLKEEFDNEFNSQSVFEV